MTPSSAATTRTTRSVTFAPRAHGGKRLVTGRVEKRDHAPRGFHVICTDMLRDATRLAMRDARPADEIQQRSLAVIDVTHHGYYRRALLQLGRLMIGRRFGEKRVGIVELRALGDMAQL